MRLKKKEIEEVKEIAVPEKKGNPLIGYTLDEIQGFVDEINPNCARGGCLHKKAEHIINLSGKLECHKCSCPEFL